MTKAKVGLGSLTEVVLKECITIGQSYSLSNQIQLPSYLPPLTEVDLYRFAVQINTIEGKSWSAGDSNYPFVMMSAIKPFVLLFLLSTVGANQVFSVIDAIASHCPFNALPDAKYNHGKPLNPMINSGAITLADLLPGQSGAERCLNFQAWLNRFTGANLRLDHMMLSSIKVNANRRNREIAELLEEFGYIHDAAIALDTYEHICCLAGSVQDLAKLGMLLVGTEPKITKANVRIVNALLSTCGLYEGSTAFAVQTGLPSKSGVSGAWLSVVPQQGTIACYSPALDRYGNSIFCSKFVEQLSAALNLHIFG